MAWQDKELVRWFDEIGTEDTDTVGGKNASLGEMLSELKSQGVRVPDGFATTAKAYWGFLEDNGLPQKIRDDLSRLEEDADALEEVGKSIREQIASARMPGELEDALRNAYQELCERFETKKVDVAVRSSATAEDLPEASFAGQQETYLNVTGADELIDACRKCYASLFTDRAISYRNEQDFDHMKVALSIGVQKMVRADQAGAGVMFSIDTETGFPDVVVINAAWGLGESVVAGEVNPDEYRVFKPLLDQGELEPILLLRTGAKKTMIVASDKEQTTETVETPEEKRDQRVLENDEILDLARWAVSIEKHYDRPMDIEWAKDGQSGRLYIVQARPETVQSQKAAATLKTYKLTESTPESIAEGVAIGSAIGQGKAFVLESPDESDRFEDNGVLITEMTDPDWGPIMDRASAIVTDQGGRTSHAAIVSRELGIPAVVGCGEATSAIEDGSEVTVSCVEGEAGYVYPGLLEYEQKELDPTDVPETDTEVMMNLASPNASFRWWNLPSAGIGLARMEFIINNIIKIHPLALARFDELKDDKACRQIEQMTAGFDDKTDYFVEHLSRGIARIAATQYPRKVVVRMSDFKTNEYADLIGGQQFEPDEANPMLGFRGASRYYSKRYKDGFALECKAIRQVRTRIGLNNVIIMIPFCRTIQEADNVLETLKENQLQRGQEGFEVYVMAEIPSNVLLAEELAERFDGFSIGTNDLTQLVLGIDRDSQELAEMFDARNEAVKEMIRSLISKAHEHGVPVSICGQAPSDHPDFAEFLVEVGIDSISVNPDSLIEVRRHVAQAEKAKESS